MQTSREKKTACKHDGGVIREEKITAGETRARAPLAIFQSFSCALGVGEKNVNFAARIEECLFALERGELFFPWIKRILVLGREIIRLCALIFRLTGERGLFNWSKMRMSRRM